VARLKLVEDKANGPAIIDALRNELSRILAVSRRAAKASHVKLPSLRHRHQEQSKGILSARFRITDLRRNRVPEDLIRSGLVTQTSRRRTAIPKKGDVSFRIVRAESAGLDLSFQLKIRFKNRKLHATAPITRFIKCS
jgi:hypothetical protein